jgi:two-component system, OmpR family, response regulator
VTAHRQHRVLVVDDERYLAELVATALRYEGFEAVTAGSGSAAVEQVAEFVPDLIVLDIMLPDGSGLETCLRLRSSGCQTPVVFLTAKDATEDKVKGLTVGGDDYVSKPFSLEELIARIRAVLRRTAPSQAGSGVLTFADLEIDEDRYEVRRNEAVVRLSPTEFKLLRYLTINAGRVLTKRQLIDHVWAYDFGGNYGVVQTYISYLRRKLDAYGPPLIETIPRVGYSMRLPRQG